MKLKKDAILMCNSTVKSFLDKKQPFEALSAYKKIYSETTLLPNNYTFSFLLTACARLSDTRSGTAYHTQIIKLGWESYDFVQNGLIHLYATCGVLESARKLFDCSSNRDVVTWTALISGYVRGGEICVARDMFDKMPQRNDVAWSAMIAGYVHCGMFWEALELFNAMQSESRGSGVRPNHAGIVSALTACAFLGALDQGRWIHAYIDRMGFRLDRVLGTALIDMYAKCGCIDMACFVFDSMPDRDVFTYSSLISGLANHNRSDLAVEIFKRMQNEGVVPNEITFICVLSACSRMGLVDEGVRIFRSMSEVYGIEPRLQHYGCFVDLLGRAGMLEQAKEVVRTMPFEPDSYVLGALLNACTVRGDVELGREIVQRLRQVRLDHSGVHVLLSNMYASTRQWDDVLGVRKGMEESQVRKVPGCSLIEVNGLVYDFVVGDRSYMFMEEIMSLLFGIDKHLKSLDLDNGYKEEDDIEACGRIL